ncbi:DUF4336 domain-containing protein [Sphingomonas sp. Leaf10]|uniref:DUF4336 domain-containing protein n=1 Tax=Sphingomonas sp. Leaf10 TaxID=1735676 RepID=UPI000A901212|nr:DUF4336 domain-containing protein [Sphingomonas sp. Leaf10]
MRDRTKAIIMAGGASVAALGLWTLLRSADDADPDPAYPPLDRPKPIADDVWVVDSGPINAMGLRLPVRMTIVRLGNGELILHSPTRYSPELAAAVAELGTIRHLIAPNVAHWTFVADWQRAYPATTMWAAPGLSDRAQVRASGLRIDRELDDTAPAEWADALQQGVITGAAGFSEMWFLHRPSRTLILVDLIENLEPDKLPPVERWLMQAAAATRGTTARYLRIPVRLGGDAAKAAVRAMIALRPERVIFAHGTIFETDGAARLARAFDWLVEGDQSV